jgi:hypothetical protein
LILLPESSWFYQLAKLKNHAPLNFHFCRINIGAVGATAESKTEHPQQKYFRNFALGPGGALPGLMGRRRLHKRGMMHSNPPTTIKIIIGKEIDRHGRFGTSLPDGTVLVGSSRQPFLNAARVLIASGYDPDSWLEGWRPEATAFALRGKLGIAAGLTVDETRTVFAPWKPFSLSAVSPSIRHSDGAATILATSDRRTSEGAPDDEAHGSSAKK